MYTAIECTNKGKHITTAQAWLSRSVHPWKHVEVIDQQNSDRSTKQRPAMTRTNLPTSMTGHCLSDTANQDAKLIDATGEVSEFQNQHSEFLNTCTNTWEKRIAKLIKHSLSC